MALNFEGLEKRERAVETRTTESEHDRSLKFTGSVTWDQKYG